MLFVVRPEKWDVSHWHFGVAMASGGTLYPYQAYVDRLTFM